MLTQTGLVDLGQILPVDSDSQLRLGFAAAVLPEQFFSLPYVQTGRPEVALMRAVLEEALTCFQYQFYIRRTGAQQLARDSEEWFFSEDTNWPFAFVNICNVLHLEPDYIRRGLRNWKTNWPPKIPQRKRRIIGTRRPLTLAA